MNFLHRSHNIEMISIHPSGDEEWYCPVCHECFFLCMPCQSKHGLDFGGERNFSQYHILAETSKTRACSITGSAKDPYLVPWIDYLKKHTY